MIVVGDIAQVGSKILFTAKMLETETGKTIVTSDGIYENLDELIEDLFSFTDRLASVNEESLKEAEVAEIPPTEEVLDTIVPELIDTETVDNESPGKKISSLRIAAFSTLAVGVISTGIGGYFIYDTLNHNNTVLEPSYQAYATGLPGSDFPGLWNIYLANIEKLETKTIITAVVGGSGLLLLGASAVLF